MNTKKVLIILVVVVLVASCIWFFVILQGKRSTPSTTSGPSVISSGSQSTQPVPSWTEPVPKEQIPQENPMKNVDVSKLGTPLDDKGSIEVVAPTETNGFTIDFYSMDSSVFILLLRKPYQATRIMAEQTFLQKFGITKADACRLKVNVFIDDRESAGKVSPNFGLSFCPNGLPLPTGNN